MIGNTLSHYRVLEELGSGGMGVVYRARDERLERDVALKVLHAGKVGDDDARRRFRREALALSRLQHPAIATVYDFDTAGGVDFLVMECVGGESLAARVARGPIHEAEVLAIGAQIADALAAAHDEGVVHRDLKPGNIKITPRGQVKVLDFGLAKLLEEQSGVAGSRARDSTRTLPVALETEPGVIAGTLAYMAPEQLLGKAVGPTSDLYSLGVLLYEMATGRMPYEETLPTALVYEIINGSPASPSWWNSQLSPALDHALLDALEKDPARRPASARAMAETLRGIGKGGPGSAEPERSGRARPGKIQSLAVLPLRDLGGAPGEEYFADGMTEAIIADLAQIGALRVISRTSVMQYKGGTTPIPEIARALRVDAIVEGSVLRSGNRVRITAEIILAATDDTVWARTFERDMGDVFALQREVSRAVAEAVRAQLTHGERQRLAASRPVNPAAMEAYLRGRYYWNQRTAETLRKSLGFFEQAIAADPTYAIAYAGLADAYNILGSFDALRPVEAYPRAKAAAQRAIEMDGTLAEGHTSLAFVQAEYDWDFGNSERAFRRAIELNPGYATARQWLADQLNFLGRFDEAAVEARRARESDPLSLIISTTLSEVHFFAREYERAVEAIRGTIEVAPEFAPARMDLGRTYELMGRYEDAIAEYREGLRITGGNPETSAALGHAFAASGKRKEAIRIRERLIEESTRRYVPAYAIASLSNALGMKEEAFGWLERAIEARDRGMVYLKVHPRLDSLRSDPRYPELLRRVGFEA